MIEIFDRVVFERKVRKVVGPNAGYSGQIGIAVSGAGLEKGRKSARNKGPKPTASTAASASAVMSSVAPPSSGSGSQRTQPPAQPAVLGHGLL